ncbi:hypothetical protein [Paraburkholderia diazotrophica]|uniref:hypothetical protein n=1 Tax=Paraburkholderia diazotrophica TaxID=667676 RepID=UPI00316C14C0
MTRKPARCARVLARALAVRGAVATASMTAVAASLGVSMAASVAVSMVASVAVPQAAFAADTTPIAPAEKLLFLTPHLHGVASQTELDYSLVLSAPPEKSTDRVRVLVASDDNAKSDATVSDAHGKAALPGDLPCNPIILYFLERDIAEMEQSTGGQRRYFQQRVRLALAAGPPVTDVTAQVDGKPVKARKIVIQPYLNDPNAERFPKYTSKRYTFILADGVPGGVSLLLTEVPGDNGDFAHPVKTESVSYETSVRKLSPPAHGAPSTPNTPKTPSNAPRASR